MATSMIRLLGQTGGAFEVQDDGSGSIIMKFDDAAQITKISDPAGGATVDSQARTAINAIIDALEAAGITSAT